MATITQKDLIATLSANKGTTMITIVASVEPQMRKTANPYFGRVEKVSKVNGVIGWQYENSVNLQRTREGNEADFESMPRTWGTRIAGTPLVNHKDRYYLELKVEHVLDTMYFVDGLPATDEQIAGIKSFMPEKKESARQEVEKVIILRDYALDSIVSITMKGKTSEVNPSMAKIVAKAFVA